MKNLLFILCTLVAITAYSQSAPSLYVPNNGDSIKIPAIVGGAARAIYFADILKNRTRTVNTLAEMQTYSGPNNTIYWTDTLRGGTFTLVTLVLDTTGGTYDGIYIRAAGKGINAYWQRMNVKDVVYPEWWGANPDFFNYAQANIGTDNTRPMQNCINYATMNIRKIYKVQASAGTYRVRQLIFPLNTIFHGVAGIKEQITQACTRIVQTKGSNTDLIRLEGKEVPGTTVTGTTRFFWYGDIEHLSLVGDTFSVRGNGIAAVRGSDSVATALQDRSIINDVVTRYFPENGIYLPDGCVPGTFTNTRHIWNGVSGIYVGRRLNYSSQTIKIDDVSGDGNGKALIYVKKADSLMNMNIVNVKSESRKSNPFIKDSVCQKNVIIFDSCANATFIVSNITHYSSAKDASNNAIKPGDVISVSGTTATTNPSIILSAASVRFSPTDVGTDPLLISGTNLTPAANRGLVVYSGFAFGGTTTNPANLSAGKMWYRTDESKLHYYDGTTDRKFVAEALAQPLTNKDLTSSTNTFPAFIANERILAMYAALGSTIKAQSFPVEDMATTVALATGQMRYFRVPVYTAQTITGVRWFQTVQGVYTSNNENRIALFTISGGTLTQVAVTADDGTMWSTPAAGTYSNKDFVTPYVAAPGYYYIGLVYNSSAQTTAPSIGGKTVAPAPDYLI
jgi:hypothetical protein